MLPVARDCHARCWRRSLCKLLAGACGAFVDGSHGMQSSVGGSEGKGCQGNVQVLWSEVTGAPQPTTQGWR